MSLYSTDPVWKKIYAGLEDIVEPEKTRLDNQWYGADLTVTMSTPEDAQKFSEWYGWPDVKIDGNTVTLERVDGIEVGGEQEIKEMWESGGSYEDEELVDPATRSQIESINLSNIVKKIQGG